MDDLVYDPFNAQTAASHVRAPQGGDFFAGIAYSPFKFSPANTPERPGRPQDATAPIGTTSSLDVLTRVALDVESRASGSVPPSPLRGAF